MQIGRQGLARRRVSAKVKPNLLTTVEQSAVPSSLHGYRVYRPVILCLGEGGKAKERIKCDFATELHWPRAGGRVPVLRITVPSHILPGLNECDGLCSDRCCCSSLSLFLFSGSLSAETGPEILARDRHWKYGVHSLPLFCVEPYLRPVGR